MGIENDVLHATQKLCRAGDTGEQKLVNAEGHPQTLLVLHITFSGHKRANVEVNTVNCVDHCDLLNPPLNP